MITVEQIVRELINPILGLVGILLRAMGALGVGVVAGAVARHGIDHKMQARFFMPLVFLGLVVLFAVAAYGTWSSPGALGLVGIGAFIGYQFLRARVENASPQDDQD